MSGQPNVSYEPIGAIPENASKNRRFALSPCAPLIASYTQSNDEGSVCIWDYWTSEVVGKFPFATKFPSFVYPQSFSPDGKLLLVTTIDEGTKATILSGPWTSPKVLYDAETHSRALLDVVKDGVWLDTHTVLLARLVQRLIYVSILDLETKRDHLAFTTFSHDELLFEKKWHTDHYFSSAVCAPTGDVVFMLPATENERRVIWLKVDETDRWKEITRYSVVSLHSRGYSPSFMHIALDESGQSLLRCYSDGSGTLMHPRSRLDVHNKTGKELVCCTLDHGVRRLFSRKGIVVIAGESSETHVYQLSNAALEKAFTLKGEALAMGERDGRTVLALANNDEISVLQLKFPTPFDSCPDCEKQTDDTRQDSPLRAETSLVTTHAPSQDNQPPIERSGELYREIKRRGLHLRRGHGRDDALLKDLSDRLNCDVAHVQDFLDKSDLSAEDFLLEFVSIVKPFATMFNEIWEYLAEHGAHKASESIAVRFGFHANGGSSVVTLEEFRRYAEAVRRFVFATETWTANAIGGLYRLYNILLKHAKGEKRPHRYKEGQPYTLPSVNSRDHRIDPIVDQIRQLFQDNINAFVRQHQAKASPVSDRLRRSIQVDEERGLPTWRLTADLLPSWAQVLELYAGIPSSSKDEALEFYRSSIQPGLLQKRRTAFGEVRIALDILDLPFWRQRWHTYEIWASVAVLRALDEFRPALHVANNYVPIDGYGPEIVADLQAENYSSACVAIQVQTPYEHGKRKAIKPDLRILFSDRFDPDQTAAIVEFKQRSHLAPSHILEVALAYLDGSPRCGGVLILNYDSVRLSARLPVRCHLLGNVQPCNPIGMSAFRHALRQALEDAHLRPSNVRRIVLLDVSSSMSGHYAHRDVQESLCMLSGICGVNVFAFNDGLVSNREVDRKSYKELKTSGGTELGKALEGLKAIQMFPDRLLVVTDGRYHCSDELMRTIGDVRMCMPIDIATHLEWLLGEKRGNSLPLKP